MSRHSVSPSISCVGDGNRDAENKRRVLSNVRYRAKFLDLLQDPLRHLVAIPVAFVEGEFFARGIAEITDAADEQSSAFSL